MDAVSLAVEFIIQGYVVVPDVVTGTELESMQDAFERLASRLGKRSFTADEAATVPELVSFIGHPRAMPAIDAFYGHFGHEPAIAFLSLCRDAFDAAQPLQPFDSADESIQANLHSDASNAGERGLAFRTLNLSVAAFLWLDDTYADAGCIMQVPGSHHLSQPSPEGYVVTPPLELIQQYCKVDFVAAKAGDVVLQRGFNIHGSGPPPRHKRRQLRADYTPKALYNHITLDGRTGVHQQFSPAIRSMLPAARQRYFSDE